MFVGFQNTVGSASNACQVIIPITSRPGILQHCSSGYKEKRKRRAKQLSSLHNDLLEDDDTWRCFQLTLQPNAVYRGITNAAVKARLFDAIEMVPNLLNSNNSHTLHSMNDAKSQYDCDEKNSTEPIPEGEVCNKLYQPKENVCSIRSLETCTTGSSSSCGHDSASLSSNVDEFGTEMEFISEIDSSNDPCTDVDVVIFL